MTNTSSILLAAGRRAATYAAKEAAKYAAQQVYKEAVKTGKSYISGTVKKVFRPRPATATKPKTKTTTYKVKPSRYTKKRKLAKLVGTTKNKNIYNRKYKSVRRNNTGPLQLQSRIQSGDSLPNMTFARLQWRGSAGLNMAVGRGANPGSTQVNSRSFCLNELSSTGPCLESVVTFNHGPTYMPLWQSLYKEYMVLGTKFTVKINPMIQSENIATKAQTGNPNFDVVVPTNAQPGYWYIRVNYKRNTPLDEIGYPIAPGAASSIDIKSENYWASLREFLSDPTVSYKKDRTVVRNKLHQHHTGDLGTSALGHVSTNTTSSFSTEIESSNRPITLSVKFSAKKDFKDKNIINNFPWTEWNTNLADPYRFHVRFGYIGFNANGTVAYHIPVDRQTTKFCEVDIQYFVGLREPNIGPHDKNIDPDARMAMQELDLLDEELDLEEEPDLEEDE